MALLDSEVVRLRYELGYNMLAVGAEPLIGVTALFDSVIQPYLTAGASTTSATAVTASTTPAPSTLTLTAATGFTVGDSVVVDVDDRQEVATVQSLSGSDIVVLLTKTHSGTYPVSVEGGESIIRDLLRQIRTVASSQGTNYQSAGVKSVDEIEFFETGATFSAKQQERMRLRDELAGALGIENLWRRRAMAGARIAL